MNDIFDVTTLIFLVLAVVIFLRLRSVLGRRTGTERPPYDPYTARESRPAGAGDGKVVTLPPRPEAQPAPQIEVAEDERWRGLVEPGSAVAKGLSAIAAADPAFDPRHFLEGARTAYEMIVTAFAQGDRKTLRPLLSREVFDGFAAAIDEREKRGERIESNFIGVDKAELVDAALKGRTAQIMVRFVSHLVTVTRGRDGQIVEGDPKKVSEVVDIWTFARETGARDPNWKLVATEPG